MPFQPIDAYTLNDEATRGVQTFLIVSGAGLDPRVVGAIVGLKPGSYEWYISAAEALYAGACATDGFPDEGRRVAYRLLGFIDLNDWGELGKTDRAQRMQLELRRQLGDERVTVEEGDRPEPDPNVIPKPVPRTVAASADDLAAVVAGLDVLHAGLADGSLTKAQAADQAADLKTQAAALDPGDAPAEAA